MKRSNPFVNAIYDAVRPPGHPQHLDHIIRGRWSNMDRETLKYHIRSNKERLSDEQIAVLQKIIEMRTCNSDEQMNAIKALKSFLDPNRLYFAPGIFNLTALLAPLVAGIMAIIVLAITSLTSKPSSLSSISRTYELRQDILHHSLRLDEYNKQISELSNYIDSIKKSIDKSSSALDQSPTVLKALIGAELSNLLAASAIKNNPNNNSVNLLAQSVQNNTAQISSLAKAQRSITETNKNIDQISDKLKNIESLVIDKPESIINLRLLQHTVAELSEKISKKADFDLLKEKELRLSDNFSKDIHGLSREVEILKWVIYLLVIGLTASGGVIVAMQRKR